MNKDNLIQINNEVYFFEEQECIHIKAASPSNAKADPVELTADQAIELANKLMELALKIKENE